MVFRLMSCPSPCRFSSFVFSRFQTGRHFIHDFNKIWCFQFPNHLSISGVMYTHRYYGLPSHISHAQSFSVLKKNVHVTCDLSSQRQFLVKSQVCRACTCYRSSIRIGQLPLNPSFCTSVGWEATTGTCNSLSGWALPSQIQTWRLI